MFTVQVILPTHRRDELLRKTLDSLTSCPLPEQFGAVHVIENGSAVSEQTVQSFADRLPVRYYHTPIGNKSRALNQVLDQLAATDFLVFLDDDIEVIDRDLLLNYSRLAAELGPGHYFGGGVVPNYEAPPDPRHIPYLPNSVKGFDFPEVTSYRKFTDMRFFIGCNWGAFTQDIRATGNFDPAYGPGAKGGARGQEGRTQQRLFEAGVWPVFLAGVRVAHHIKAEQVSPQWILDRQYKSAIYFGKEQPTLRVGVDQFIKLSIALLVRATGSRNFSWQVKLFVSLGYFYGLAQRWAKHE